MKSERDYIVDDTLIIRYLTGEGTADEAAALHHWMEEDTENVVYFSSLEETWHQTHPARKLKAVDRRRAWDNIEAKLKDPPKQPVSLWNNQVLTIAATILLLMVTSLLLFVKTRESDVQETVIATTSAVQRVSLPDRSEIVVNKHSRITFPESFTKSVREVQMLAGEIFFSITPDKQKPFIIRTELGEIKVVGTSFDVILKGDVLQVSVREGSVLLHNGSDSVALNAGQTGIIQANKTILSQDSINVNAWAYATHRFVFNDVPVHEVLTEFENAYPYNIRVANKSILQCRITATLEDDSAENLLHLIAEPLNLSVVKNGMVFTLEGEGCP